MLGLSRLSLVVVVAFALAVLAGCGSDDDDPGSSGASTPKAADSDVSLDGCTPEETAKRYPELDGKKLKIAVNPVAPPYAYADPKDRRKIIGFDADYVEAWTQCLGLEWEWQSYQEVGAMIAAVQAGRADLVQDLFVNPSRSKQMDFVVYMKSLTGSVIAKGNPKKLEAIGDLCGNRAAQAVGVVEVPLVEKESDRCEEAGEPPIDLTVHRDNNVAIQSVVNGRADAFLGDVIYVKSIAERFPDKVQTGFTVDTNLQIGIGVNQPQDQLQEAIVEGLRAIQENGTQDRLLRRWDLETEQSVAAHNAR